MTVSASYAPLVSAGNDATTEFSPSWPFFSSAEIKVTLISSAGVETVKSLTTHYTVSGGTDANGLPATGTITMLTAPATGETLVIERVTTNTQATSYANNDAFGAKTHEAAYDRRTLVEQEAKEIAGRSLQANPKLTLTGRNFKVDGTGWLKWDDTDGFSVETVVGDGDMHASAYDPAGIEEQLVGLTATQTLTNKTLTQPTITLKQSAAPTPTAEGDIQWDTDDNTIKIGDSSATQTFSPDSSGTQAALLGHDGTSQYWRYAQAINVLDYIPKAEHAAIRDRSTTTDLTTYVANAIAALPSVGGILEFPEGKYICDTIRTPALGKPTWFRGAGRGRTLIQALSANSPIFAGVSALDASSPYVDRHRHSGFTCVAHASGSTGAAIDMRKWSFSEVSDIGFAANGSGKWTYGFLLDSTDHCYSNRIDDVAIIVETPITTAVVRGATDANYHILSNFRIIGTTVTNVVTLAAGTAIYGWYYLNWHVEGVSGVSGVAMALGDGHFNHHFVQCWFEDVGDTFSNTATTTGSIHSCVFSGANVQGIAMPDAMSRSDCTCPSDSADVGDFISGNLTVDGNLLLPSASVINFASADVTITHSSNALAFAGASSGYSFDSTVTAEDFGLTNGGVIGTSFTAGHTYSLSAWDVDGAAWVPFLTLTANNTPTCDLADSVTKGGQYIYRAGGTDVPVTDGGTGLSAGTSGGVPYFSSTTAIASSGELTADRLVKGGGAGAAPAASGITCDGSNNLSGIGTIANTGSITMTSGSLVCSDGFAGVSWGDNYLYGSNATDQIGLVAGGTEQMVWNGTTGGVICGSPTGSFKGAGTLNAVGVYDDNTLLTDYVFDRYLERNQEVPYSDAVRARADELDASMFDLSNYVSFWREHGRLWGMPDLDDCIDGRVQAISLGGLVQRLWQALELQAIHNAELLARIERLERGDS